MINQKCELYLSIAYTKMQIQHDLHLTIPCEFDLKGQYIIVQM